MQSDVRSRRATRSHFMGEGFKAFSCSTGEGGPQGRMTVLLDIA
jgi:hypothetical protein